MRWLLLLPLALWATETRPWFEPVLEPEIEAGYSYETYDGGYIHRAKGGMFINPLDTISAELEVGLAGSRQFPFYFNFGALTGRYQLLDQLDGHLATVATGLSVFFSSVTSRRDFATPFLGPIDWELHVAIGRELDCGKWWLLRGWGWGGAAISHGGAPRLRGQLAIEANWCDLHQLGVATWGVFGFGKRQLSEIPHFQGYGPVQTRAVDVGLFYTLCTLYGRLQLEYRYRPYARNYPRRDHRIGGLLFIPLIL
jgi:hypothetical protein